jgi:hypothetical protein
VSPGSILTGIRSQSFALADFVLGINVAAGTMGGRGEREIGSRALLAGRTGGSLAGRPMDRAGTPRLGGSLDGDNVKLE